MATWYTMGRGKKRSGQGQSVERYVPCFGNRQESHGKKKKKRHGNSNELAHKVLLPLDQDTEENSKPLTQTAEVQQSPKKLVNEEQFSETLGHAATSEAMVFTSPKSLTQTPADTQQPSMVISSQAPTFQQDPTHITTPQQCPQLILAPTTQNDSDSEIQTTPQANGGKDVVFDSHIMDPFSDSCTGEERKIATLPCGEAKGHGLLARDTINTNGLDLRLGAICYLML